MLIFIFFHFRFSFRYDEVMQEKKERKPKDQGALKLLRANVTSEIIDREFIKNHNL